LTDTQTKARKSDPLMVQSVAKAFRVLEAFGPQVPSMTLSEIAQQSELDLSAAQRFTHTLHRLGYLDKDPVTRQFSLSIRALDLAHHYTRSSPLVRQAMPVLQHLSKETEETVNLTMLDRTEIVYVARIQSRHVLSTGVTSGTRLPAFCMSPGRAILSRMTPQEARAIIDASTLTRFTSATETDPERLMEIIAGVREAGYAACFEELYHGDASIAAAVLGPGGRPLGAVSIATSLVRFSREEVIANFSGLIIAAARSISNN